MMLHYAPLAPNPDRVKYFLQEKGVWADVPKTELNIIKQDHRRPEYLAMSPLGHVPVLQLDDGSSLTESRAICTYFEGVFPEPNLMGRDATERAKIEMWDRRVELSYLFHLAGWFRNSHPAMAELEKPQSKEWAEISSGRARGKIHHRRHHPPRRHGLRPHREIPPVGRVREPERLAREDAGEAGFGVVAR
jgi:glutathione S-transferase